MSDHYPWFRFYSRFMDDPKIKLLAFEDRAHFVNVLCMKCKGDLDTEYRSADLRERAIAMQLQLSEPAAAEAKRRLFEVGLINERWQPTQWEKNQKPSDHSAAERQRRSRLKKQSRSGHGNVTSTVTTSHGDSHKLDIDKEEDKDKEGRELRSLPRASEGPAGEENKNADRRVTPEAEMAIALSKEGVKVTSMHPTLVAWVRDGFTIDQAKGALAIARQSKGEGVPIPANYLDTILRQPTPQRRQAGPVDPVAMVKWTPGGTNATV